LAAWLIIQLVSVDANIFKNIAFQYFAENWNTFKKSNYVIHHFFSKTVLFYPQLLLYSKPELN